MNKTLAFLIAGERLHAVMAAASQADAAYAERQGETNGSPIFAAAAEIAEQGGEELPGGIDQEGPCLGCAVDAFAKATNLLNLAEDLEHMAADLDRLAEVTTDKLSAPIGAGVYASADELRDAASEAREEALEIMNATMATVTAGAA